MPSYALSLRARTRQQVRNQVSLLCCDLSCIKIMNNSLLLWWVSLALLNSLSPAWPRTHAKWHYKKLKGENFIVLFFLFLYWCFIYSLGLWIPSISLYLSVLYLSLFGWFICLIKHFLKVWYFEYYAPISVTL